MERKNNVTFWTLTSKCDLDLCRTLLEYKFCTMPLEGEHLTQVSKISFKGLMRYGVDTNLIQNYNTRNTKGLNFIKNESKVMFLFLCTSLDGALYVYKLSWRNLKQFSRYGADMKLIWNYYKKNTKGNNSVKTESRVMVLFLCTLSDGALYLYKLSWRNLKRFSRYGADTKIIWNYLPKIQREIIPSKLKVG